MAENDIYKKRTGRYIISADGTEKDHEKTFYICRAQRYCSRAGGFRPMSIFSQSAILAMWIICLPLAGAEMKGEKMYRVEHEGDHYFDGKIPADFFEKIAKGDFNRNIYVRFSDRKAWARARKSKYAEMIIKKADEIKAGEVPQLLFSEYRRYATEGNRSGYERPYFKRRENMGYLALALCLTGDKAKYMPRLLDHVVAVIEEFTWCIPAHAHWVKYTRIDREPVDLFAAQTGATMAILYHILGEELDKEVENISEKIREMTLQRVVYNTFYDPESSRTNIWYGTANPVNWTPWCSYNILITAILLEKDNARLATVIRELLRVNANYASRYSDDGYCDEGPSYYNSAGLKLFGVLHLMHKIRPGSMDTIFSMPRIRAIFEFISRLRIGKNHQVNFGDALPVFLPEFGDLLPCGELLKSDLIKEQGVGVTAALGQVGDHMNTGYKLLFDLPELPAKVSPGEPFSYFKDRLAILRSEGFSAALKAGTNGEEHNHNDLGNLVLYFKGSPVIVDAGREIYSRINFSEERYSLWYTRGSGHNAPVFEGVEQIAGKEYRAFFETADAGKLVLNLDNAYPEAAGVKKYIRKIDFSENKVVLEDSFKLVRPKTAEIKFLSPCEVEKLSDGGIRIGEVAVELKGIEIASIRTLPKMNASWDRCLTEIMLKSASNSYCITFKPGGK